MKYFFRESLKRSRQKTGRPYYADPVRFALGESPPH